MSPERGIFRPPPLSHLGETHANVALSVSALLYDGYDVKGSLVYSRKCTNMNDSNLKFLADFATRRLFGEFGGGEIELISVNKNLQVERETMFIILISYIIIISI